MAQPLPRPDALQNPPPPAPPSASHAFPAPPSTWQPLPAGEFNASAARHLLRRAGWTARPADVEQALREGLPATLDRLFPATLPEFAKPALVEKITDEQLDYAKRLRDADEMEKRAVRREIRDRFQQGMQDLVLRWLTFAREPEHSASEKWVLFLSDVYVVAYEKVRNPAFLWQHQATLRRHGTGPAPALAKAVLRSPAMIDYLDLKDSKRNAPNENFARELFELFALGEGNYTEADIKEAARAFTGYRQRLGEFHFIRAQHDPSPKKLFGVTKNLDGDGVIDLTYQQPAASTFLPKEMWRFYVSEKPIPAPALAELGAWWRDTGHHLQGLQKTVFGSRLFFAQDYRANFIKSPLQFYLGSLQDLDLDVTPLARQVIGTLRQMGQMPFNPPNVRGWVGGRAWINSTTLAARRQLVQALFTPINEANLNADDLVELTAARSAGHDRFTVPRDSLSTFVAASPAETATKILERLSLESRRSEYESKLSEYIRKPAPERVREALVTLLQAPEYQLC